MNTRRKRMDWRGVALLLLILVLVALYDASLVETDATQIAPTQTARPTGAPQLAVTPVVGDALLVYMTTDELVYPDVPAERTAPALYTAFLADIEAAQASIDIAVFDIDLPELGDALLAAHARGVTVRVAYDDENLTDARVAKLIGSLQDAQIAVRADEREPFMHEKTAVIDRSIVWTGSWNMTMNDTYRNNNSMVRIVSPQMAIGYVAEADQLMSGLFGVHKQSTAPHPVITLGKRTVRYAFSPIDGINAQVVSALDAVYRFFVYGPCDRGGDGPGQEAWRRCPWCHGKTKCTRHRFGFSIAPKSKGRYRSGWKLLHHAPQINRD